MSCGPCNCNDCLVDRLEVDQEELMPPTPRWHDANLPVANEAQTKAWLGYVNEVLDEYKVQGMPMMTMLSVVARKIPGLRPENYSMVMAQVERTLRESPDFELRKGKSGGIFRKDPAEVKAVQDYKDSWKNRPLNFPPTSGTLPAPIQNVVSVTLADNYTCKGCGNSKLNSKEKSCWKCGRTVGT